MIVYKYFTPDLVSGYWVGRLQWEKGVRYREEWGGHLFDKGCIHVFRSWQVAVLARQLLVPPAQKVLWKCTTTRIRKHGGLTMGVDNLTPVEPAAVPVLRLDTVRRFTEGCVSTIFDPNLLDYFIPTSDVRERMREYARSDYEHVKLMRLRESAHRALYSIPEARRMLSVVNTIVGLHDSRSTLEEGCDRMHHIAKEVFRAERTKRTV